ncbi:MAG TPA: DUF5916 domain-containing protein [Bacteroidia bacterium]|nr:DUF5916 domain-containing protein [Bacteroidia bacterium]
MRFLFSLLVIFIIHTNCFGQTNVRTQNTTRVSPETSPVIDGRLDDAAWKNAKPADQFIQQSPRPGEASLLKTDVRVVYTNEAIYIAARMFDPAPDSILHQLSPRDEYQNNTDAFGILLDPYHDRRNGFFFAVTAAGVQTDSRYVLDKSEISLNSVWYSKVLIDSLGWTVEMKIPFQALRFPDDSVQVWGVNYTRIIRRYREQSWWNAVDPNVNGLVNQSGDLEGLQNIDSPVRLALFPYVSGYYENYNGENAWSANGGMDLKYGITEGFTLDVTLIPDFGQTQSDNLVLNLSPFEVRYDERRYFFTEGTELFNKHDLFYSRRVGVRPAGYYGASLNLNENEVLVKNPASTRLYNGIKLSGRTRSNLAIGMFNAVAAPMYATIKDTSSGQMRRFQTGELANYNCFVLEQLFGNSYVGLVNTLVLRSGSERDANVSSFQGRLADKKNRYAVEGYFDYSLTNSVAFGNTTNGHRYHIEGGKVSGKFIAKLRHHLVSQRFDCNDMGYLDRNNYYYFGTTIGYNEFTPKGRLLWMTHETNADVSYMYDSNYRTFFTITGRHIFTFRNFMTIGANWLTNPIVSYDFFETRTPKRYLLYPRNYELGGFLSSDYRKKLAWDLSSSYRIFLERNRSIFKYAISPRWRVSDKLFIVYRWEQELKNDNVGYVTSEVDGDIVFGLRNLNTVTSTLTGTYIFTNRMGVSLRVRHYWSEVAYKQYFLLNANGTLAPYAYGGNADLSFTAFNVDLVYTWQFLPGSELSVVWKNAILSTTNVLFGNYQEDLNHIFDSPQSNSLSLKLIWYVDAGRYLSR